MARTTVAVSGYFSPLHVGHLRMIEEARGLGDRLVVIVNSDYQAGLKKSFPFMDEQERLVIVQALRVVDFALLAIDKDRSVCRTLDMLRPQVFANGGDVTEANVREKATCENLGIRMVFGVGGSDKIQSSSSLIARAGHSFRGIIEESLDECRKWRMTDKECEQLLR